MSDDNAVSTEAEEREPGSTHTSAQELGDITAQRLQGGLRKLAQTVGTEGDGVDYYRFTLSEAREVRLGLKLRQGEAELSVEDAEGNVLARSMAHAGYEAAVRTLLPGTYYVRVEAVGAAASEYEFRYGVLEANASFRPASDSPWHTGLAERMGMPSFGEAGYAFELSETVDGRVSGVLLGRVLAVDPNGEELSYRIVGGNGSGLFALGGASGELSYVGAGEDFEGGAGPYELTVRASDGTHTIDTTVTVTITDAAEAPVFGEEGYAFALTENVDGSVSRVLLGVVEATDPDSDTVRYSLLDGNDSSLFAIEETSGELFYVGAGEDFEGGVTSYELTIRASDGTHTIDTTVTVTVTDAAEAPAFGDESYAFELAENADGRANGLSLGRVLATDPDGDEVRYSLTGGNELFTVDETSGELYYVGPGEDYESGVTSHEVTVRASDAAHTVDTTVTVTVTDAAEAPAFGEESYAFELAENVDGRVNRLSLGAVTATDPDSDAVRYSLLVGNDSSLFAIEETSGELSYVGAGEDFEGGVTSYEVTVRASDAAHTVDTTVTVTVTDAAEAPAFGEESYAFELAENADGRANGLSLGRVLATDPDGDEVRYSLTGGNESMLFNIDETSGELYYVGPGEDYESGVTSYELTVRASDAAHTVDTTVTVTVTDAAEAPAFGEESYAFELAENVDGRVNRLSLGLVAATDPDSDAVRYSLVGGNDSDLFNIGETSGELFYVGAGEDFEGGVTSYELTVRASDGTDSTEATVTVTVTDEAEAPAFGEESYAFELAENVDGRVNGLSLGSVTATDPDSDGVRYSLLGVNDSSLFAIEETSGELFYVGAGEDFEGGVTSYELTVRASDAAHTVDTTVTVTVTDAAEAPAFGEESYAFELAENVDGRVNGLSLGTVTATDPDIDTVRYSLLDGNDSSLFAINETSGELFYVGAGEDFEGGVTSYELTVRASDAAHTVDTTVTVTVTDEGEAPAFGEESYAFELAENVDGRVNRLSLGSVTATDPDSDAVRYSLLGGNDSSLFAIEETSGELSYVGAGEDFEGGVTSYELTIRASDGTHTIDTTVTVTVTDAAEQPAFGEGSYAFELAENADGRANGLSLGRVTATDPDGDEVRYSLTGGNESMLFTVDAASGELYYVGPGEDYESGVTSYEVTVRASDAAHTVDTTVTVTVTDAAEAPAFGEESYAFELAENVDGRVNRLSLGTVTATDPDSDTVRYSLLVGNDSSLFAIEETSGELFYVGAGEDFEGGVTSYELTIRASDGTHTIDTTVTVTVTDAAEQPAFGEESYAFELAENADGRANGLSLGRVLATDPDGDEVRYSLTGGNESMLFNIDETSGELYYVGPGEDYESGVTSYEVTVRASDAAHTVDTTVTVTVTDAAEQPAFGVESYAFELAENVDGRVNRLSLGTVTATDPDSDAVRYSLVGGNDSDLFNIGETSGELFYVGAGEDFEGGVTSYELTVRASDGTDSTEATVTVTVTDEAEAPAFGEESYAFELAENVDGRVNGLSLGSVTATDPDSDGVRYSLLGVNDSSLFAIEETSGELFYVGAGEDFEGGVTSYELTVRASDGTDSTEATVTVTVTDAAEAPAFGEESYAFELAENVDGRVNRLSLGSVTATDPDSDAVRYSLAGGNDSVLFAIDETSGELYYGGPGEDYESGVTSYELTVRASDGTHAADTPVTVTVTDAADAPLFAEESYAFALSENTDGSVNRLSLGTVTATDPDGAAVRYSLSGGNDSSLFAIGAASGELYYVGPGEDYEGGVTSYELTVRASDGTHASDTTVRVALGDVRGHSEPEGGDLPQDRTTTGLVLVDEGAVTGNIEMWWDLDWFAVELVAGRTYQIDFRGQPTGDGTLVDPSLYGVFDGDGRLIPGTTIPDGGTSHNSRLVFTAPGEGTYYIATSGNGTYPSGTGTYELEVRDVRAPVFAEAGYRFALSENAEGSVNRQSLGTVTATDPDGGTVRYRLVGGNESRRFAIDPDTGEVFYVGPGEDYESRVTSHELTIRASDGAYSTEATVTVTVTDVAEAPAFSEESYAFELPENVDGRTERQSLGTVAATDPDGGAVRYSLAGDNASGLFAIEETSGELYYVGSGEDYEGDADPYELAVRASDGAHTVDTMVTVTVVDNPFDSEKSTNPQGSSEPAGEDLPAGRETNGVVGVDSKPVDGTLGSQSDRDWFAVTLAPGRTYAFTLEGDTPLGGIGAAPAIRALRDSNGDPVAGIVGGVEVRYTTDAAAAEAVYYIEVGSGGDSGQGTSGTRGGATLGGVGTRSVVDTRSSVGGTGYRLWANDITETRDAADDYPSRTSTTGVVTVGGSVRGEIERYGDRDWFAVPLEAGKTYRFDLEGSETRAGSLRDPFLYGIYDAGGTGIDGTEDNDSGAGFNSRVTFTATADTTHYVAAGAHYYGFWLGTYKLSVTDVTDGIPDDYAAGIGTSGRVEVGGSATGKIDYRGDRDWFAVTLEAGKSYRIGMDGSQTGSGTLRAPDLRGVHDANGVLLEGTTDHDHRNSGDNSRAFVTVAETGLYHVAAGAARDGEGTYTLTVTEAVVELEAGTGTSGRVEVGGSVMGEIEIWGDRDWFAVTVEAGKVYQIDLEGRETGAGSLFTVNLLGVHDADGALLDGTTRDNRGSSRNDRLHFGAPEDATQDATYYVAVGTWSYARGTYKLSVKEVTDDFAAWTWTSDRVESDRVEVGGSAYGKLDYWGDHDWIAVSLEAGKTYRIDLEGRDTGAGTWLDPWLYGVHDADGVLLDNTSNHNGGQGRNSRLFFTAKETATYYVEARDYWNRVGTYTLSVTDVTERIVDDFVAGTGTSGTVEVGGSATGEIDFEGDRDWFAVTLEEGRRYRIDMEGRGTGAGTLFDPHLYGVHDSNGRLLGGTTDASSGASANSRVFFTSRADGIHYVAAGVGSGGFILGGTHGGTYTLLVTDVTNGAPDDFAAGTGTSGRVEVGGSVTGDIETSADRDWFAVTLDAGKTYRIDLEGWQTSAGTLHLPKLHGVHDAHGVLLNGTTSEDGGSGHNSRVTFTAPGSATYYVAAGTSSRDDEGTYTLSVTDVTDSVPDDFAAGTRKGGTVQVGASATGEIETSWDRDWFTVTLEAGRTYRIDLEGIWTKAGTLREPYLHGVHDAHGALLDGTTDNRYSGAGYNTRVYFTAASDDTYYVAAGARRDFEGTYTLSVTDVTDGAPDDFAADTGTTGTVMVGGSVTGDIETSADRDWFAVTLEAGKTYRIDLNGSATGDGTLYDPYLHGVHDANRNRLDGTTDDDDGVGFNSRVFFAADAPGIYYVAAGASGDWEAWEGTYTLSVEEVTDGM